MRMCQKHWDMLREEVIAIGLEGWIAQSGETAAMQLFDGLTRGEDTRVNYDPLMNCWFMIMDRTLQMVGPAALGEGFGCPVCELNSMRTEDGRCACGRAECGAQEPGSVPDHEEWLVGPHSCAHAAKHYMQSQGWLD